jgi:hypothetical protein
MNHGKITEAFRRFPNAHRCRVEPERRDFRGQGKDIAHRQIIPLDLVTPAARGE